MKHFSALPTRLVAMAGALAWGLVMAVSAAPTATSVQAPVSGQVGGDAAASQSSSADSTGGAPASTERVTFSGSALIKARVIEDPDFRTPPIVVLSVDLSGITGVGATSRKKYVTTNETIIQRRLRPSDSVALSFPFWPANTTSTGSGPLAAITISLTYNVDARTLIAAAGSITSP